MEHPIQGLMTTAMNSIKDMIDVNTIIGDPIATPDGTIIPVSKVSFGFASGGSDFNTKKQNSENCFGGGSGAGITITPIAFLVITNGQVKLIQISENSTTADKVIAMVPDIFDKIREMFNKKDKEETEENL